MIKLDCHTDFKKTEKCGFDCQKIGMQKYIYFKSHQSFKTDDLRRLFISAQQRIKH